MNKHFHNPTSKLSAPARVRFALSVSLITFSMFATSPVDAATVTKANNTNDLSTAGSWNGGVGPAPTNIDIATWDSTVTGANTSSLLTTSAWLGIKIGITGGATAGAGPIGIILQSGGSARTLTLGTSGIDMSTATQDLTISGNGNVRIASSSSKAFNVASGRTLNISSSLNTQGGTIALSISGAGNTNLSGTVSNSTSPLNITNTGTGILTFSGAVTDFVSLLSATGSGASVVVNGATVSVGSFSTYGSSANASKFTLQSGAANFNGGVQTSTADGSSISVTGGAFSAASVTLQRTASFTTLPAAASTTSGFIVSGGTANLTGGLFIGTSNSSASALERIRKVLLIEHLYDS